MHADVPWIESLFVRKIWKAKGAKSPLYSLMLRSKESQAKSPKQKNSDFALDTQKSYEIFLDLIVRSRNFVELKECLNGLLSACKEIIGFYSKAKYPVRCTACQLKIRDSLYHCDICVNVNLCKQCWITRAIKSDGYYKHDSDHYKQMKVFTRGPNTVMISTMNEYSPQLVLKESFLNIDKIVQVHDCPQCGHTRGIRVDSCNTVYCTKCRYRFCFQCKKKWEVASFHGHHTSCDNDVVKPNPEENGDEKMLSSLFAYFADKKSSHQAGTPDKRRSVGQPNSTRRDSVKQCTHSLFSIDEIFDLPTRCSFCNHVMVGLSGGVVMGECGHILCPKCCKHQAEKSIAAGVLLHFSSDDSYGLQCPVSQCKRGLVHDPHVIKGLISPYYYDLYLYLALLLSQKKTIPFRKCATCGRTGILDLENKFKCFECNIRSRKPQRSRVEIEGWLSKRSPGVVPHWRRRYFYLRNNQLLACSMPEYIKAVPKSPKVICDFEKENVTLEDDKQCYFSLTMSGSRKKWYQLYAESLTEKEKWMDAISSWLHK